MARIESIPKRSTSRTWKRRQRIGRIIQFIRESITKITRDEAARRAGVSVYTWQRWEQGSTAIPLERMADIAKALSVDLVDELGTELQAAA
jgi:transcriptional regulator with XRE-family HTH domain